ncbi:hypothetical protein [Maribacter luteus]|uniref:hypothetical protein n=1 Tax=Maribacter luteus TaxID=2594478 RepID=UPI00249067A1|nr:hypothetical protein [Maribacter luteus]
MENPFEIIDKRLERIEQLLVNLTLEKTGKDKLKYTPSRIKMPTDEEMTIYLLKTVFSKKKS